MTITQEISILVTDEDIDDIMVSALEGGVNYWCYRVDVVGCYKGEYASEQIARGGELQFKVIEEFEDGKDTYLLNKAKLISGLKRYLEDSDDIIARDVKTEYVLDTCNIDGCRADMIIQYALFGELIYG